jgi:hypothetical protein
LDDVFLTLTGRSLRDDSPSANGHGHDPDPDAGQDRHQDHDSPATTGASQ